MKLFVGNLSFDLTDEELRLAFEAVGKVESATIIRDMFSRKSKGFGFVEMPSKAEAQAAIDKMNGTDLKGRSLNVNEARPRTDDRGPRRGHSRGGHGHGGRDRGNDRRRSY